MRPFGHDIDIALVRVTRLEQCLQIGLLGQSTIQRGVYTADQWRQVGNEGQAHLGARHFGQTLTDLWVMAMASYRIGLEVVAGLGE